MASTRIPPRLSKVPPAEKEFLPKTTFPSPPIILELAPVTSVLVPPIVWELLPLAVVFTPFNAVNSACRAANCCFNASISAWVSAIAGELTIKGIKRSDFFTALLMDLALPWLRESSETTTTCWVEGLKIVL